MEIPSKARVLDIGGGPDWLPMYGHGDRLLDVMRNLHAAQLAQENPDIVYIVLDACIPRSEAKILSKELPNLYFVENRIVQPASLPFAAVSVERVEINHMWTPLTAVPTTTIEQEIKGIPGATDYLHVLKESCRILKSGGILSITEKEDRLKKARFILSRNSDLNLDGLFMQELGLDMDPGTQSLIKITNDSRSQFTNLAFKQGRTVYCLELIKKRNKIK